MFWKKSSIILLYLLIILIFILLFCRNQQKTVVNESGPVRKNHVVTAIEKVLPSVVNISTERIVRAGNEDSETNSLLQLFDQFLRSQEDRKSYSLGSGFVIDPSGLIVTNAHVVDRATRIVITLNNGMNCEAVVLAADSLNDIALLKLKAPHSALQVIPCSKTNKLYLGETVIAVGNPFGLGSSISVGALSGEKRRFTFGERVIFSDILQTDAIVYPGNSGGPLINIEGGVIGMNMSVYQNAPGIGFAIPFTRVENVIAKWMLPERFCGSTLGIVPGWGKEDTVVVADVLRDSPAMHAGIVKNTTIRKFNGKEVHDLLALSRELIRIKAGETISVETSDGLFKIKMMPNTPSDILALARRKLGLDLIPFHKKLASELGYPLDFGMLVGTPLENTPAGIRRGDLLVRLGPVNINTTNDLAAALKELHYNDVVKALFLSRITVGNQDYLVRRTAVIRVH